MPDEFVEAKAHRDLKLDTVTWDIWGYILWVFSKSQKQWYTKMDGYCLCVKGSKGPESVVCFCFFVFGQAFPKNQ